MPDRGVVFVAVIREANRLTAANRHHPDVLLLILPVRIGDALAVRREIEFAQPETRRREVCQSGALLRCDIERVEILIQLEVNRPAVFRPGDEALTATS